MNRLMHLKTSELNYSTSSELGYETANDDTDMSLYYSINDNSMDTTLEANSSLKQTNQIDAEKSSLSTNHISLFGLQNILTAPMESQSTDSKWLIESNKDSVEPILSSIPISIGEIVNREIFVKQIFNSDSKPDVMSDIVSGTENVMEADSYLKVANIASNIEINLRTDSVTLNDNISAQDDVSEGTVSEQATGSKMKSTSMTKRQHNQSPMRGSKLRRTMVQFRSTEEIPHNLIPHKTTTEIQRTILSSWNSLSRRSIVPKPILKKTLATIQPIKNTVSIAVSDVLKHSVRPRHSILKKSLPRKSLPRKSLPRKSLPRKSLAGVAGPSDLARKEFIPPKGDNICNICKKSFPLRSTLTMHKLEHKNEKSVTDCKYCDRSFKKPIALLMHLKENCEKIPAAARKKILNNEFDKLKN